MSLKSDSIEYDLSRENEELTAEIARLTAEVKALKEAIVQQDEQRQLDKDFAELGDDVVRRLRAELADERAGRQLLAKATDRINDLEAELAQGYELSTYTAAINWDNNPNTQEWLDGLKERIEAFQASVHPQPPAGDRSE